MKGQYDADNNLKRPTFEISKMAHPRSFRRAEAIAQIGYDLTPVVSFLSLPITSFLHRNNVSEDAAQGSYVPLPHSGQC